MLSTSCEYIHSTDSAIAVVGEKMQAEFRHSCRPMLLRVYVSRAKLTSSQMDDRTLAIVSKSHDHRLMSYAGRKTTISLL